MRILRIMAVVLALPLSLAVSAQAQVVAKTALTLDGAKRTITAAVAEAKRINAPGGAIAVVDDGGNLMALERLDNTFAAGANISIGKARTAAVFKHPTKAFEDIINRGRTTMVALTDFTPLQGGVPIIFEGQVIGGIGVSGAASAQQDEEIALAGAIVAKDFAAKGANGARSKVTYIDREKVASAFAKGAPLIEVEEYKVHASRREAAGMAEVHMRETDVIYVLEGTATFVTGGTVVDGKVTTPGEIRGTGIRDGETRRLAKGDVIIVPERTPHWFKEVEAPFLYFVVKPISPSGGSK
ncbi:MAG: heme-binding protein [Candidatus Methylomirabilis oxyfera]|nr:heme-binding protein [Candidatus Methylomirabilis oxyfera]